VPWSTTGLAQRPRPPRSSSQKERLDRHAIDLARRSTPDLLSRARALTATNSRVDACVLVDDVATLLAQNSPVITGRSP